MQNRNTACKVFIYNIWLINAVPCWMILHCVVAKAEPRSRQPCGVLREHFASVPSLRQWTGLFQLNSFFAHRANLGLEMALDSSGSDKRGQRLPLLFVYTGICHCHRSWWSLNSSGSLLQRGNHENHNKPNNPNDAQLMVSEYFNIAILCHLTKILMKQRAWSNTSFRVELSCSTVNSGHHPGKIQNTNITRLSEGTFTTTFTPTLQ